MANIFKNLRESQTYTKSDEIKIMRKFNRNVINEELSKRDVEYLH